MRRVLIIALLIFCGAAATASAAGTTTVVSLSADNGYYQPQGTTKTLGMFVVPDGEECLATLVINNGDSTHDNFISDGVDIDVDSGEKASNTVTTRTATYPGGTAIVVNITIQNADATWKGPGIGVFSGSITYTVDCSPLPTTTPEETWPPTTSTSSTTTVVTTVPSTSTTVPATTSSVPGQSSTTSTSTASTSSSVGSTTPTVVEQSTDSTEPWCLDENGQQVPIDQCLTELPATGSDWVIPVFGAACLAAGALMVLTSRRRGVPDG